MIPTFQNMHEVILAKFQFQKPFDSLTFTPFVTSEELVLDPRMLEEEKTIDRTLSRKY